MASSKTGRVDRTYLAVKRQTDAMGCLTFEVGIRNTKGQMMTRQWSKSEVLKSVDWLKRENAKGSDIYVRPASKHYNDGIILIDDLSKGSLERMKQSGLAPACVVETSPQNYQAWLRISPKNLKPEVATTASQAIAKHFGGDLNSADWRHFGRLSGFTNRKPEHTTETGHNPWVLCHDSNGKQAERGLEMVEKSLQALVNRYAQEERENRFKASLSRSKAVYGRDPTGEYQKQLKTLTERYGASMDVSKADYMISKSMIVKGYKAEQITQALEEASPELPTRKTGHEKDYCERTVAAALKSPDVQEALAQKEASISRGYGMSR